jgi:hypothetical protein
LLAVLEPILDPEKVGHLAKVSKAELSVEYLRGKILGMW